MTVTTLTDEEFKLTEIGPLPKEWDITRLGEFVEEVREKNKSNFQYPVFTVSNQYGFVLSDEFFDKRVYSKKLNTYKIVRSDYFAYNPYRVNVGSLALLDQEVGLVSPAYVVFRVSKPEHLYPPFLYRLIKSPRYLDEIRRIAMSRGSVRRSLSFRDLSDFQIPLPQLAEQRKIAYFLSTVQTAIEKTEALIRATRELKKSLTKHLFTYGPVTIDQAENMPLKETEIGLVPEGWDVIRLGMVCQKTRQTDPRKNHNLDFCYVDVSSISRNTLRIAGCTRYSGANAPSRARKVIRQDDVIFATVRPYLKRFAIVPMEFDQQICSTAFCVIRANPALADSCYLFYAVSEGRFVRRVTDHQRGSNYPAVTDKDVLNELISLPPLQVQKQIAGILSNLDSKIEAEENKKRAREALFKTLLTRLMNGKIRVKSLEVPV